MVRWFLVASPFKALWCHLSWLSYFFSRNSPEKKINLDSVLNIFAMFCSLWLWAMRKQQIDMWEPLGTLHLETDSSVCTVNREWMNSNKSRQGTDDMYCLLNKTEWRGEKFPPWAVKTIFYQHQVYLLWRTTHHLWLVELPPGLFPAAPAVVWAPQCVFRVRLHVIHAHCRTQ